MRFGASAVRIMVVICTSALACDEGWAADGAGSVYAPGGVENPILQSVVLPGLDGSGYLRGYAADVDNAVHDITSRACSPTLQFNYDAASWSAPRVNFSEVMAYYYSTSYYNHTLTRGFPGLASPISIVVYDGAWYGPTWYPALSGYSPSLRRISLGSDMFRSDTEAMDESEIIHEFTHALQHQVQPGMAQVQVNLSTTDQARAILEGHADFAAASYFSDPQVMKYASYMWGQGAFRRNVDNFYNWSSYSANPGTYGAYTVGMVYTGALWDLRSAVGADVSETLAMKTVAALPDNNASTAGLQTSLSESLQTMLQVDADTYAGAHADQIRQAFAVHGIGTYDFSTPWPMVLNPSNSYDGTQTCTVAGAKELSVTFDQFVTKLDDAWFTTDVAPMEGNNEKNTEDFLQVLDGSGNVVGTYTGRELQGQTIRLSGDTVSLHLVTDAFRAPFGYRVTDVANLADVNRDSTVDAADIDDLRAHLGLAGHNQWDLDDDGAINQLDVDRMIKVLLGTSYGDANLDQKVGFHDFQTLLNHWGASSTWATGDFNQDHRTTFTDFQLMLNNWDPSGLRVPEPASLVVMVAGAFGLVCRCRRKLSAR